MRKERLELVEDENYTGWVTKNEIGTIELSL